MAGWSHPNKSPKVFTKSLAYGSVTEFEKSHRMGCVFLVTTVKVEILSYSLLLLSTEAKHKLLRQK